MEVTLSNARLLRLLILGGRIPYSRLSGKFFEKLLEEKILLAQPKGRTRKVCHLPDAVLLERYLSNHCGISDLEEYITLLESGEHLRAENILVSADSKLTSVRTFQGFLVNTFVPIPTSVNGEKRCLKPSPGCFTFVYDYSTFMIPEEAVVVGIENPENFRYIERQQDLFQGLTPLFVSRYPQSQHKDLISWLQKIPNRYLHFGDFDFAGILIYQKEYKRYLGERATFFVPAIVEQLLPRYGNRTLYDNQLPSASQITMEEENVAQLINLIHREHKGLEQETLIT